MRYLILTLLVAAATSAIAMPPPEPPACRIKLADTTVHVGTTMKAMLEPTVGGYITGATLAGRPIPLFDAPATWVADKEGTFTVEGTISGPGGTNRCSAEYTVVAGNDPKPQAFLDLLGWPKADNFYCRVKYYGSSDRKGGALFDMSLPIGAERFSDLNSTTLPVQAGVARTALALGESNLRLQLTVDYEMLACRDGAIPQNEPGPVKSYQSVSIRPLLYRGDTLIAPIAPVVVRKAPAKAPVTFNCWGQNFGGYQEVSNGRVRLPDEPLYFETTTGNGVLQVKCSNNAQVLMAPFPEPPSQGGPIPTR